MNKEIDMLITQLEYRGYIQQDYKNMIIDYLKKYKDLQHQLEEKDKIYAKITDEIYDYLDSNRFCENFEHVGNETNVRKHIFEILERGKNDND